MTLPAPYYDQDGIVIYLGDCRDILPDLERVWGLTTHTECGIVGHDEKQTRAEKGDGCKGSVGTAQVRNQMAVPRSEMVDGSGGGLFSHIADGDVQGDEPHGDYLQGTQSQGKRKRQIQGREAEHALSTDDREGQVRELPGDNQAYCASQERGPHRQSLGESSDTLRELPQSLPQKTVVGAEEIVCITDPPYGINHASSHGASWQDAVIAGDTDTTLRDVVLQQFPECAAFGTWKTPPIQHTRGVIVWDKGPASGMGDLSFPFKLSWEQIFICGRGWRGRRDQGVWRGPCMVTWESKGRHHPHQKPVELLSYLLSKHAAPTVLDPFMGSGTTLVAAKLDNRKCIGIEIEERYAEIAANRLAQGVFDFGKDK